LPPLSLASGIRLSLERRGGSHACAIRLQRSDPSAAPLGGQGASRGGPEAGYVNTGKNKPLIMQQPEAARKPVFQVLSYERR
jgi:hypothetical protein